MRLGASSWLVLALAVFAACLAALPSNKSVPLPGQHVQAHDRATASPGPSHCRRYFGCTPIALRTPQLTTQ